MKDQVDGLNAIGISACYLNSSLDVETKYDIREKIKSWTITIVYLAPESLHILDSLKSICEISLVAIDEAHCISGRGHDFRPAYKELQIIKERLPQTPVVALTATADQATREDILKQLELPMARTFLSSFDRPNLSLEVRPAQKRIEQIIDIIQKNKWESGIIYCMGRKTTEQIAAKLTKKWIKAASYHAWLWHDERERVQEWFLMDRIDVVCATIAFGMGIDKSNVRFVMHYNLPKSIESFYQEIGRAWRDGLDSETILFYSYRDVSLLTQFASESGNAQVQLAKLERMKQYAESLTCRRKILMNYFWEITISDCGNCDICLHPPQIIDGTVIAQKALSTLIRLRESEAMRMVINVLRGSLSMDVISRNYHEVKTHGIGKEISTQDWNRYLIQMINLGLCQIDFTNHEVLRVTDFGKSVLSWGHEIELAKPNQSHRSLRSKDGRPPMSAFVDTTSDRAKATQLFGHLKQRRLETSRQLSVPAYVIFSDKTLKAIAKSVPQSLDQLQAIEWIGAKKLKDYGKQILEQVAWFDKGSKATKKKKAKKKSTYEETWELYQQWLTHTEIALQRWVGESTIITHLTKLYQDWKAISFEGIIDDETIKKVQQAKAELGSYDTLKPYYEYFDGALSYDEIRVGLVL